MSRRRLLFFILTAGALMVASLAALLPRLAPLEPPAGARFDAVVVLGCRVERHGRPSPSLERRTRRAAELMRRGLAPTLVTTGGVGEHPPAEARVAERLARDLGVEAIAVEERSSSTEENARFAAELGVGPRVLLVTDDYHTLRSRLVFARYFDHVDVVGVRSPEPRGLTPYLREVAALVIYGALGRLF